MPQTDIQTKTESSNVPISAIPHKLDTIKSECNVMLTYALKNGIILPNNLPIPTEDDFKGYVDYYNVLSSAIHPVTSESITYVENTIYNDGKKRKWYNTPLISKNLAIAIFALIVLVTISLSPEVNMENQANGLLSGSGKTLFLNLAFICSASLLGIMFYLLKTINSKIKNFTLLPVDAVEVNSMILVGIISGFIISELFSFSTTSFSGEFEMNKMTLALLGGFSSDAIFSVLQSIVSKINNFISPTNPQ